MRDESLGDAIYLKITIAGDGGTICTLFSHV
jgi:hypothetical protein